MDTLIKHRIQNWYNDYDFVCRNIPRQFRRNTVAEVIVYVKERFDITIAESQELFDARYPDLVAFLEHRIPNQPSDAV